MKVLLTGATGFVGSHILDVLIERGIPTRILARGTSNNRLIHRHLGTIERREGSVTDLESLQRAMEGITHVIHSAGCTKALRAADYFQVNQLGTRNVVAAASAGSAEVRRLVHISSLAAAGPATAAVPSREDSHPSPVSAYGQSKLASEAEVRQGCKPPFVIIRPPGVYGPRDRDFLTLFKAVRGRLLPEFGGGRQELSLVYVADLAEGVVTCLEHPQVVNRTYNIAAPAVITARQLGEEVAKLLGVRVWRIPLPVQILWPICALQEGWSRWRGRPHILSLSKYPELAASGWVCDASRLRLDTGFEARTTLAEGLRRTLDWYRVEGWL